MPDLSRSLVHLRWLLKLVDFRATGESWARYRFPFLRPRVDHPYTFPLITGWNYPASYAGLLSSLEDIRLLLDQQSKAQFQWTPYEDLAIRAVILDEYFQNPNASHAKVALVNYATVEMHQSDRSYYI
ncbi:hypothetical protein Gotur_028869 [Gossypium turneri]